MSIDINDVSFKINENRWLEIWVGEQEVVSVDTTDGGVLLCGNDNTDEIGNIMYVDGTFEFVPADEEPESSGVFNNILTALERIERKL